MDPRSAGLTIQPPARLEYDKSQESKYIKCGNDGCPQRFAQTDREPRVRLRSRHSDWPPR